MVNRENRDKNAVMKRMHNHDCILGLNQIAFFACFDDFIKHFACERDFNYKTISVFQKYKKEAFLAKKEFGTNFLLRKKNVLYLNFR